jgi:hypothetical protein
MGAQIKFRHPFNVPRVAWTRKSKKKFCSILKFGLVQNSCFKVHSFSQIVRTENVLHHRLLAEVGYRNVKRLPFFV